MPKKSTPKPGTRVTIRDLAKELNLSDRAVSQALTPRESNVKLKPETVERVQALAQKWGYQPDSRARSMRYGKFFNIGYLSATKYADSLPLPGAEAGVFEAASEKGYKVVLIRRPSNLSTAPEDIPNVFKESLLDALILSHEGNLPSPILEQIDRNRYPVIYLNEKKLEHNAVYTDDTSGMEELTQHLIDQGRTKVAYLANAKKGNFRHYSERDRLKGYEKSMRKANLKANVVYLGTKQEEIEKNLLEWFDTNHSTVNALACSNDFNAMRAQKVLYPYREMFPDKIAITGYDDMAKWLCTLPLTTMRVPYYEMGRAAVEMAIQLIDKKEPHIPSIMMNPELVVRDSTPKLDAGA